MLVQIGLGDIADSHPQLVELETATTRGDGRELGNLIFIFAAHV